jgi:uncharacterized protein (DUF2384 family)
MITSTYDGAAEERVAWLADRAVQVFHGDPLAARRWLEQPRRDLAGFTPAQCALLGGAPLQRVSTLLERICDAPATTREQASHDPQLVGSS